VNSVNNLMGYRWIAERVKAGTLTLHAWWFNLTVGQLYAFNPDTLKFVAVVGVKLDVAVTGRTPLSALKPEAFAAALAGKTPAF
jgi:carbonic anhydrase